MANLSWQFLRLEHGIRLGSCSRYDLLWRTQSTERIRSLQITPDNHDGTGRPDLLPYQSSWFDVKDGMLLMDEHTHRT
jgi:hypothetical protein